MHNRVLIYLAGPYSSNPILNTHQTLKTADELIDLGYSVFVPHLSLFWDFLIPKPYTYWLDYDMSILKRCDILYRLKGKSIGADKEVKLAEAWGIPVFYERDLICKLF